MTDVDEIDSEWLSGLLTRGGSNTKALLWIGLRIATELGGIREELVALNHDLEAKTEDF